MSISIERVDLIVHIGLDLKRSQGRSEGNHDLIDQNLM
jgi:hypothetical protein